MIYTIYRQERETETKGEKKMTAYRVIYERKYRKYNNKRKRPSVIVPATNKAEAIDNFLLIYGDDGWNIPIAVFNYA